MTNNIPFGYPIYLLIKFQSNNFNDLNETDSNNYNEDYKIKFEKAIN